MVEPEDVVLAQDDPGASFQDDRALDLPTVDEADGAILWQKDEPESSQSFHSFPMSTAALLRTLNPENTFDLF